MTPPPASNRSCPLEAPVAGYGGFQDLPEDAPGLVDSAPIIYFLEGHAKFGPRFKPLFAAHAAGHLRPVVQLP
jgi:hypothetical protein